MRACPRHPVVVLEERPGGAFCFLCKAAVEPIEVEDPESKLLGFRRREKPELPDDEPPHSVAAKTLRESAEAYARDGFPLRAVAVWRQVLKLAPADVEVHMRLAELYVQLGLTSDAAATLEQAEQLYLKRGDAEGAKKARDWLQKLGW